MIPLNELRSLIKADLDRIERGRQSITSGRQEWIEGSLALAEHLAQGRAQHENDDRAFGQWLKASDLDDEQLSYQDRAALIGMASDLSLMRRKLSESISYSWRMIYGKVKGQFIFDNAVKDDVKTGRKPTAAARILEMIRAAPDGLTCEQIAVAGNIKRNTVGPRLSELLAAGQIVNIGKRETSTGNLADVVYAADAENLPKGPRSTKQPAKPKGPTYAARVMAAHKSLADRPSRLRTMTRQEFDPNFNGDEAAFVDKYGHVQVMTAEEYAADMFNLVADEWASIAKRLERFAKDHPRYYPIDLDKLRRPRPKSVATLKTAITSLEAQLSQAQQALAIAEAALARQATKPTTAESIMPALH